MNGWSDLTKLCPSKPLRVTDWLKQCPSPSSGHADMGLQGKTSANSSRASGRQPPCIMGNGTEPYAETTCKTQMHEVIRYRLKRGPMISMMWRKQTFYFIKTIMRNTQKLKLSLLQPNKIKVQFKLIMTEISLLYSTMNFVKEIIIIQFIKKKTFFN